MWVGKFALSPEGLPAGGVAWVDLGTTAASSPAVVNGAAYHPTYSSPDGVSALYVTTEAVAAGDAYIGGFRYRLDGALRVYDATSAVPAGANTNQGIALTSDGQLCYTTGNTTSFNLNGVAVDTERRVYAAPLAFELQFADAGAGVVDTTEAITGATPTFTRATAATTVLSTGLIGSVASGDPRSYYDPTTLAYLGYLAEGARTNLCLQSEDLATTWTTTRSSASVNAATAPDGTVTADKLVEDATAANNHNSVQLFVKAASALPYALSLWVKAAERTRFRLQCDDNFADGVQANFNIGAGTVSATTDVGAGFGTAAATIKAYPNGWYRCELRFSASSIVPVLDFIIFLEDASGNITYDGDGTSGMFFWGMQLEQAAFASSYIPTTTLAVARNADVLTYPTSPWLNASAGTIYSDSLRFNTATTQGVAVVWLNFDNYIAKLYSLVGGGNQLLQINDTGVLQVNNGNTGAVANTSLRGAISWLANDFASTLNGGSMFTDTSGTVPSGLDTFYIGNDGNSNACYGPIRRVAYYGARLANATLQGLTS